MKPKMVLPKVTPLALLAAVLGVLGLLLLLPRAPVSDDPQPVQGAPLPTGQSWEGAVPPAPTSPPAQSNPPPHALPRGDLLRPPDELWAREQSRAENEAPFAAFRDWVRRYQAASDAAKRDLETEGIKLSGQRRAAMSALIQSDPRRALELAVPLDVREELPASVNGLLEKRVSGRGDYVVMGVYPPPGEPSEWRPYQRTVALGDRQYRASVYGQRLDHPTKYGLPLNGVAVDEVMAVNENAVRLLERSELRRLTGRVPPDAVCGVSASAVTVVNQPTPVDVGGETVWLCRADHAEALNSQLLQAAGTVGDSGTAESPYTEGRKRIIMFRVAFSNVPTPAVSSNSCATLLTSVDTFWRRNSYGRTSVAPPGGGSDIVQITLPSPSTAYDDDAGSLRSDVRAAASAQGIDLSRYDFDITYTGSGQPAFGFGGLGVVGGPGAWVVGSSATITVHELGHNLGFPHANFWNTGGESAIGEGANQEYGDPFDVMGGGSGTGGTGPGHYVSKFKWRIGWIADEDFPRITNSGLYRIYVHDNPDSRGLRGVRFRRDATLDYFLEFRQLYPGNPWMMNGIGLRWGSGSGSTSQLIDTTPGSSDGKDDSPIVLGRTFSDAQANTHITPVALGHTFPESIDVVVSIGPFPANQPPRATVSASSLTAAPNSLVSFTANAHDPNGDTLAYHWEFGDGSLGQNSPSVTKSWPSAGEYVVRCTVSDLKGGTASDSLIVRVGNPATFSISGRVLDRGQPLEGVLVRASPTRHAYTDSDGSYTITRLTAGSYSVTAQLYPYTFVKPFSPNPVNVGPDANPIDFVAVLAPQNDVSLVSVGAVWRYLDNGSNQGTGWSAPGFNDGAWASGPAELGYGDDDEATVVSFGPSSNNKYITTYFRRAFNVANPAALTNLTLNLLRDDGAVVYLNGVEVMRNNLPGGTITFTTLASASIEDDNTFIEALVDSSLLVPGSNILAAEVHQGTAGSSDLSFDLSLTATTRANLTNLAAVYIASPADNETFSDPATVPISVVANHTETTFTRVEFYDGSVKLGEDDTAPFGFDWADPPLGSHVLTARALAGTTTITSAPVRIEVTGPMLQTAFIAPGALWKYWDAGSDPGAGWAGMDFADGSWPSGVAELGFGDGDEASVINGGPPGSRYITTYFRHTFNVDDAALVTNLTLRVLRDDGAAVYLNGREVFRDNLPPGPLSFNTLAVADTEDNNTFITVAADPDLLVNGPNLVAVEIHQSSASSSDLSFDLALTGWLSSNRPPGVYLTAPAHGASVDVSSGVGLHALAVPETSITKVEFYAGLQLLGEDTNAPFHFNWVDAPLGVHGLTAVGHQSGGGTLVSAPITIVVTAPGAVEQLISPRALWNYLDDGSNQGTGWKEPTFDDSGWRSGYARLGYGNDGEYTMVSFGGDPLKRYVTTYFRRAFSLGSTAGVHRLQLHLWADDGAVVYLNGVEVLRHNLASGLVSYNSLALANVEGAAETGFIIAEPSPALLVAGTNVVAVEVHQAALNSADLGFDLALTAETGTSLAQGVYLVSPANGLHVTLPGNVELSATTAAAGQDVMRVEFFANGAKIGEDDTAPHTLNWNGAGVGSYALTAAARLGSGASLTSAPVNITADGPPSQINSVFEIYTTSGSTWKYWTNGATPSSNWNRLDYSDAAWPQGPARFGWGLDGERTPLPAGRVTHYFRRTFQVANPALIDTLVLQLQRDDGAVVYLNGFEILRNNLPSGPLTSSTLALAAADGLDEQQFFITILPASGLLAGTNVVAAELHQSSASSSDGGFDLHLSGGGSTGPRVVFASPANHANYAASEIVPIQAYAWAGSGRAISKVEFFANGAKLGESTNVPYQLSWDQAPVGSHELTARLTDNFGATAEGVPVSFTVGYQFASTNFIPAGSVWKYLANGSNQGTNWAQRGFNDSAWPSGRAQLGYGDSDETTTIPGGPSSSRYITTYFRRWFSVPQGLVEPSLTFRLLRDDGAVVWLNGKELYRDNMPAGPISSTTTAFASVANADEDTFFATSLAVTGLSAGTNLLAVEIHQQSPTSSDLSFDLQLDGAGYFLQAAPPQLEVALLSTGQVRVAWPGPPGEWDLYGSPALGPSASWTLVSPAPMVIGGQNVVVLTPTTTSQFYRLQRN